MNWLLLTQRLLRHDGDVMLQFLCNRVGGATCAVYKSQKKRSRSKRKQLVDPILKQYNAGAKYKMEW